MKTRRSLTIALAAFALTGATANATDDYCETWPHTCQTTTTTTTDPTTTDPTTTTTTQPEVTTTTIKETTTSTSQPSTTSSAPSTTTSTVPLTTSTSSPETSVPGSTTSPTTSLLVDQGTPPTFPTPQAPLPRTGSSNTDLIAIAVAMLVLGAVMIRLVPKRP